MQILYNAHSHTYKYSPRKIPPCWPKTHMFYSQETSRNNYGNSLVNVSILSRLWYNSCSGEILFTDQIYRKFLHWEISPGHLAGQQSKVIFSYWELEYHGKIWYCPPQCLHLQQLAGSNAPLSRRFNFLNTVLVALHCVFWCSTGIWKVMRVVKKCTDY